MSPNRTAKAHAVITEIVACSSSTLPDSTRLFQFSPAQADKGRALRQGKSALPVCPASAAALPRTYVTVIDSTHDR